MEQDTNKTVMLSVIGLRGFPSIEGGVEKHCEALYPKLRKNIFVTVYRRKPYVYSNGMYSNIQFIDFPSTKIKGLEPFFHSFISSINVLVRKPDAVHYHNIGPAFFSPIVKIRRIPVILTFHSPNYEHEKWGKFGRWILLLSEKIALRFADKVVFVNSFQMERYGIDIRKKSVYIPNGINSLPISLNIDYLEELGLKKKKYILSVGRITQEKGFDILIKAYKSAKKDGFKLVIAGGVEFENKYMKKLEELGKGENIVFTGYIYGDKLHQLYTHAGLYVLASRNEGFPLVLLEAMKYGLDVIASDIPAAHLVALNKEDYFNINNYKELADKISERIKSIRSRKYDLSKYDWAEVAEKMSDIFDEAARK